MAPFNTYPAVDENFAFPPEVRAVAARSPEMNLRFDDLKKYVNGFGEFKTLTKTDNLNTLPPGRYTMVTSGDFPYSDLNYPVSARGMLIVYSWNAAGSYRVQQYFPLDQPAVYTRMIFSETPRAWIKHEDSASLNGFKSLTAADNLDTLPPGRYAQVYANQAPKELGYPVNKQGMLHVFDWNNAKSHRVQTYYPLDDSAIYTRMIYSNNVRPWTKHGDTSAIERRLNDLSGVSGETGGLIGKSPKKVIAHTEKGHPFYVVSGTPGTYNLNDTTDPAVGFQSIKVTSDGQGGGTVLKADNIGPIDLSQSDLKIWIKVDDWSTNAGLSVFLGIDGMANYVQWSLNSPAEKVYMQNGTWHLLNIPTAESNRVENVTDYSRFTHLQIKSSDNSTGKFTYHLGPVYAQRRSSKFPKGAVSFSFDDTLESLYTQAKPIMDQYGFSGTAYITPEIVGKTGRASMEQLRRMQDYSGWEIAGHSFTSAGHEKRFTEMTESELDDELKALAKWLKDNYFNGTTLAYPGGMYNDTVSKVTLRHFKAGRSISQLWETLPPGDFGALRTPAYVLSPSTKVEAVKAQVDMAMANGYWLHICLHDVLPEVIQSTDYPSSDFREICDYIYKKQIPVLTVAQVVDETLY